MVGKTLAYENVYKKIKHAVMSGMFLPGQRIDNTQLKALVGTSHIPIREALRRLSAEGLVEAHPREGFYIPHVSEQSLSGLYDWLLNIGSFAARIGEPARGDTHARIDFDKIRALPLIEATATLFLAIGIASGNDDAEAAIRRANDRLHFIRTMKETLLTDREGELAHLITAWQDGTLAEFEAALTLYCRRRQDVVPKIVHLIHRRVALEGE